MLLFLKGLFVAVISGSVVSVVEMLSEHGSTYDVGRIRNTAIMGAAVGLAAYLKQSPIQKPPAAAGEQAAKGK
jgi:hypothetical protein